MRLILDSLAALMLLAIVAGVALHYRTERDMEQKVALARSELQRLQAQVIVQAAMEKVERNAFGYPKAVDPVWFGDSLPMNPLLGGGHPWIEVAGAPQRESRHPPRLMAGNRSVAQFWYSPYQGVVRARVPADLSDAAALDLYNKVNGTKLKDLFENG